MRNKKYITFSILFVLVIGAYAYFALTQSKANLNITISPSNAKIVVDKTKSVHTGMVYVPVGKHTAEISFAGFTSQSVSFTTTNGQVAKLSIALTPNSQTGYTWLNDHPKDVQTRQNIGGEQFNDTSQNLLKNYPIVARLPYIGTGTEYRVDYGAVTTDSGDSKLNLSITFYTVTGKQEALEWIQSQGYPLSSFIINYIDQTSQAPTTNNPYTN